LKSDARKLSIKLESSKKIIEIIFSKKIEFSKTLEILRQKTILSNFFSRFSSNDLKTAMKESQNFNIFKKDTSILFKSWDLKTHEDYLITYQSKNLLSNQEFVSFQKFQKSL